MSRSWMVPVISLFLAAAGCDEGAATALGTGGNGGDGTTVSTGGDGGGATSTTSMVTMTTTTIPTTTSTTSTGGGDCDPPAPEGSLYALTDIDLNDDVVSMCKYRGDVLLIVNVAEA